MRRSFSLSTLIFALLLPSAARAAGPADSLFRLVPPDVSLALSVENLRDQSREIKASPLFAGFRRLPAVDAWIGSGSVRGVRQVVRQIEEALGIPAGTIREEIFGDAMILALRSGPPGASDTSRGLLISRARDRALLDRLILSMNKQQTDSGEVVAVVRKPHKTGHYMSRKFAQAGRPDEFYARFDDGVFAWSNSESLIREVMDRRTENLPSLGQDAGFREVRDSFPSTTLLSLYLSPRILNEALGQPDSGAKTIQDRILAMATRYVSAIRQFGVALEWRDGIAIHSHEALEPEKLDRWLRDWLARPVTASTKLAPLPASAIAAVVLSVDFEAARDAVRDLIPDRDRDWYRHLKTATQGLLIGQDIDKDILPRLGPGLMLSLDAPDQDTSKTRLPIVLTLALKVIPDNVGPGPAIENAIRTGMSIYALDSDRKTAQLRIEDRTIGATRVVVLSNTRRTLFAMATQPDRITFGNQAEAVARSGSAASGSPLEAIRSESFPEATTFAIVDLTRLAQSIRAMRNPIAERLASRGKRDVAAIGQDMDQMIAAADLFRAATFTTKTGPDARSIHRVFRLIAR